MATCAICKSTILFGGFRDGNLRYCSDKCRGSAALVHAAQQLPPEVVRDATEQVYRGRCPRCKGPGPVELHMSHRVWSIVFLTHWSSTQHICCGRCGVRRRLLDTLFCLLFGWWGFPHGLIMTPIQVARNLAGLSFSTRIGRPSPQLENAVRLQLAASYYPHPSARQQQSGMAAARRS